MRIIKIRGDMRHNLRMNGVISVPNTTHAGIAIDQMQITIKALLTAIIEDVVGVAGVGIIATLVAVTSRIGTVKEIMV